MKSQIFNIPLEHNSVCINKSFFLTTSPDSGCCFDFDFSSLQLCMRPAKKSSNTQSLLNQLSTFSNRHFHANLDLLLNLLTAASTSHSVFTDQIFDRPVYLDVIVESLLSCGLIRRIRSMVKRIDIGGLAMLARKMKAMDASFGR